MTDRSGDSPPGESGESESSDSSEAAGSSDARNSHGSLQPEPTHELIRAARAGEPRGWSELHRRYRSALRMLMRGRVPRAARAQFDTDDLLQSGFLVAVEQLDRYVYQGPGSFERWMKTILESKLKDKLRKLQALKRGKAPVSFGDEDGSSSPTAADPSPAEIAEDAEHMTRLALAIGELSDVEQMVIQMVSFDKLPRSEVARVLGKSPTTVGRHLGTALEKLHHRLNQ